MQGKVKIKITKLDSTCGEGDCCYKYGTNVSINREEPFTTSGTVEDTLNQVLKYLGYTPEIESGYQDKEDIEECLFG